MAASPRKQQPANQPNRGKNPPPMVIQGDFRKVSGISTEIFRQIEQVENDHDATTAAALETVDRRGEMVVRILDPRSMGRHSLEVAKGFLQMQVRISNGVGLEIITTMVLFLKPGCFFQDAKHIVQLVEIVKRPGQTLGLYIREGNGMERSDGVFVSRIALESAVYNSGCLQVGDEILAVNLVDVTRMSLDDVVIIMSIPRRLVLAIRQRKGMKGMQPGQSPLLTSRESKPPPVVVIKKHFEDLDRDDNGLDDRRYDREREREREREHERQRERERHHERERDRRPRSRLGLGFSQLGRDHSEHNGLDLYYNSRPESSSDQWSYRPPPPPVITEQPKPQHFTPYDRQYPKTLESLAEKVHAFYPAGTLDNRRGSPAYSSLGAGGSHDIRRVGNRIMPRSGSDQHLPRVEYEYGSSRLGSRQTSSLLRSSLKSNTLGHPGYTSRFGDSSTGYSVGYGVREGTLSRKPRAPLDYSSDTEATIGPRTYYQRRGLSPGLTPSGLSNRLTSGTAPVSSLRSNSLPRDHRGRSQLGPVSRQSLVRFDRNLASTLLGDDDSDGALSAPELPSRRDRISSTPSVFTSDEYRAWLSRVPTSMLPRSSSTLSRTGIHGLSSMSRTPSTSAIYERIRAGREAITQQRAQRFTFSAENLSLLDRHREDSRYSYRGHLGSTLDRPRPASTTPLSSGQSYLRGSDFRDKSSSLQESADKSMRRIRQLMELEAGHIPNPSPRPQTDPRSRLLDINPAEFLKYKMEKSNLQNSSSISSLHSHADVTSGDMTEGMYGLLWVHLLAGRGLRASTSASSQSIGAGGSTGLRDLYCVLECDRVHKARTVVRTGDIVFDWDETFELDLIGNRELDLLIYSWDPQYRHKLCYKGSVHLLSLLKQSSVHQLALKIEPRGTLYLRLRYTDPQMTFSRKPLQQHILARPGSKPILTGGLFGSTLESTIIRENVSIMPGGMATSSMVLSQNVPLIIKRCVEEIERRGLDIIGLYRLCGSATKKRILREGFERNSRTVDLTPDNVPDINVITGVLKDYLRELPEPLFTKCLYQMLVDVISVCLPDDPEGNAKLIFSILDCLPKVNRATLIFLMDHLSLVVSQSDRNKMTAQNLSVIFGPILMLHAEFGTELDFNQPITILRYLLEIWKHQSGALFNNTRDRHSTGANPLTRQSQLPQHLTTSKPTAHGVPDKSHPGPIVVTSPGSPTSESSRSSSSISPSEAHEILSGSKSVLSNKNLNSSGLNLLTNKTPSQISLLGSNSSITNKSPSQISLLGSNSSIGSPTRSNVSISDAKNAYSSSSVFQANLRKSPMLDRSKSPYGSPNLGDRSKSPYLQSSKSPYGSPILDKAKTSLSQNFERSKSPIDKSKGLYTSPNMGNQRDIGKSPLAKNGDYTTQTLDRYGTKMGLGEGETKAGLNMDRFTGLPISITSSQICEPGQTAEKPMFSTLPRQRSIPTIIGMPRRLSEQRKSLPQVPSAKPEDYAGSKSAEVQSSSKNPFEKLEGFKVSANPSGKNPFLDETEDQYNYQSVSSRVNTFEQKTGNGTEKETSVKTNPYVGVHTSANAMYQTTIGQYGTVMTTSIPQGQGIHTGSISGLQYSVPISSGMHQGPKKLGQSGPDSHFNQFKMCPMQPDRKDPRQDAGKLGYEPGKTGMTHEEVMETPTPSSSTGTDSSRKEIGQEGDVESDADEVEIAEQGDMVPELGSKMY
ncbi:hypothetical protein RUM43_008094 [Polyplax serrata]|uniref:Rho GTPase-activating protein 100F n=1 Tax=Polyplax serrata TaxID=468196 RepID=A0AAN8P2R4_POLSC